MDASEGDQRTAVVSVAVFLFAAGQVEQRSGTTSCITAPSSPAFGAAERPTPTSEDAVREIRRRDNLL